MSKVIALAGIRNAAEAPKLLQSKRGLTCAEAMVYVGVKRRTFDELWRPRLTAVPQGTSLVFDREDLDRLFDEFKQTARGPRPTQDTGVERWAVKTACTRTPREGGGSTSFTATNAFKANGTYFSC